MRHLRQLTNYSNRAVARIFPLFVLLGILVATLPTASAFGNRSKAWEKKREPKPAKAEVATGNVASSTSVKRKGVLAGIRERREAARSSVTTNSASAPARRVEVRATAQAKPEVAKAKREGLFVRMFKPESMKKRSDATANVAVAVTKKSSSPAAPNPSQAAPKYNYGLMSKAKSSGGNVVVNIARQRAYLYVDGQIAIDTPVSTARSGKSTPRGSFSVGQRVRSGKISTIYHVEMPYWMRLGQTAYGMHAGYLPGYPASAGCIRMPYDAAQKMFDCTSYGTRVRITNG